jgi:hypothetical protein
MRLSVEVAFVNGATGVDWIGNATPEPASENARGSRRWAHLA